MIVLANSQSVRRCWKKWVIGYENCFFFFTQNALKYKLIIFFFGCLLDGLVVHQIPIMVLSISCISVAGKVCPANVLNICSECCVRYRYENDYSLGFSPFQPFF